MRDDDCTWPNLVYRFVEHYKWEPQHLLKGGTVEDFYARIRRQEVPLNFLLNLLLYSVSAEIVGGVLRQFGLGDAIAEFGPFRIKSPWSPMYTQPDVRLESAKARIFIELKVDSKVKTEQVWKYLLLHAEMDTHLGRKQPFLLFLTKNEFEKSWSPRPKAQVDEVHRFLSNTIGDLPVPPSLVKRVSPETLSQFEDVRRSVTYRSTTWSAVGAALRTARPRDSDTPFVSDFVAALEQRGLA